MFKLPFSSILAPMAGITDRAHRVFMRELGAPAVMTELISSEAFVHGSKRTREMMEVCAEEGFCGVQIFGHRPDSMAKLAQSVADTGASFIDINFGCPVNKVTRCGGGAAALKNLGLMRELVRATRAATELPLSIKIRSGWDEQSNVAEEVCELAAEEGVDWIAIHARSRERGYHGPNDWDLISRCRGRQCLPVVGNGELKNEREAHEALAAQHCDAVMIGRAALVDPLIFSRLRQLQKMGPILNSTSLQLIERFTHLAQQHLHPKVQLVKCKKMATWLSLSLPHANSFRSKVMGEVRCMDELLKLSEAFFGPNHTPSSPQHLGFLKGGHG